MTEQHSTACAVLFPGQGSQESGMGRDLAEASKEAMDLWKKAEAICGARLREIYWDGDDAAMSETRYLQPALTVVNVSFWMHLAGSLRSRCPQLSMAGHSLGEYSALAAAEVLSLQHVLELVSLRGRLMAEADPEGKGAMAALLKLDLPQVGDVVRNAAEKSGAMLVVANYNSPAQYVISGRAEAVAAAEPLVKEHKGRMIRLAVSGAFHSPMMETAARELAGYMGKLAWSKARYPLYMNTCAQAMQEGDAIMREMKGQMTSSVQWIATVEAQWRAGVRWWCEVGPKTVLAKLLKPNLAGKGDEWEVRNVGSLEQAAALSAGNDD